MKKLFAGIPKEIVMMSPKGTDSPKTCRGHFLRNLRKANAGEKELALRTEVHGAALSRSSCTYYVFSVNQ